jgi:hypothetical protein
LPKPEAIEWLADVAVRVEDGIWSPEAGLYPVGTTAKYNVLSTFFRSSFGCLHSKIMRQ